MIMEKFNLSWKLFDMDDIHSDASEDSVIYISSGEEDPSGDREADNSTDTEELVACIEK